LEAKASGRAFRDTELFDNPFAGLVTGILVTVLVQSSSTSTSIIISMTAGDLITIKNAIPMIMGANIGTSVTNTIVSLGHMGNKDEYRRAFAGATVHDMFNLLNVFLFLPIEAITGMLSHIAGAIVDGFDITDTEDSEAKTEILKAIVKPVNNRILAIDKKMITSIAKAITEEDVAKYDTISIIKHKQKDDNHMFLDTPMSDGVAGALMVLVSLGFLCLCLILMVKVLQSIFRGRVAILTRRVVNMEFESAPGLANYFLIAFGAILTLLFQSSSVTTSTLTPLVGIGLVRIEKMFAFTVGANVGTCITGILSALVTDKRKTGLTVALSHLLFNILGMLVWYPIPIVRNIPIAMAKMNGNMAADLKWWPWAYIVVVFLVMPAFLLGVSAVHWGLFAFVGIVMLVIITGAIVICYLRLNKPTKLPLRLQADPRWLPNSLRINKTGEAVELDSGSAAVQDADIGKDDWRAAPVAWGGGWFVLFALLVALTNAKWADIKFPAFDKRDHVGFSAWKTCSYSFKENDMVWAKPYDLTQCTDAVLEDCASKSMATCQKHISSSNVPDVNKDYEASWIACRETCPMFKWSQWCENQACGGTLHLQQCQNVSSAVMRPRGSRRSAGRSTADRGLRAGEFHGPRTAGRHFCWIHLWIYSWLYQTLYP
jgi:sodium-dependent phosphate cotransporter